jgi:hypothetical protein
VDLIFNFTSPMASFTTGKAVEEVEEGARWRRQGARRTLKALGGGKAQEVEVGAMALGGAGRTSKAGRCGQGTRRRRGGGGRAHMWRSAHIMD